jgi:Ferric reductase NAD binding domain
MKDWFAKELDELNGSPLVKLTIYVTRAVTAESLVIKESISPPTQTSSFEKSENNLSDPEKSASALESFASDTQSSTLSVMDGRPDISAEIRAIVSGMEEHERTIVAACGPESLMKETRAVVGDLVVSSGRSVTLHCEQFGW